MKRETITQQKFEREIKEGRTDFSCCVFKNLTLSPLSLKQPGLCPFSFICSHFHNVIFQDIKIQNTLFTHCSFKHCEFISTEFIRVRLLWCDIKESKFSDCIYRNINFTHNSFESVFFDREDLNDTSFRDSTFRDCCFIDAKTLRCDWTHADTSGIHGKAWLHFQANTRPFAYYHEGFVIVGCKKLPLYEWIGNYEKIGKTHDWIDKDIKLYGDFFLKCKDAHNDYLEKQNKGKANHG